MPLTIRTAETPSELAWLNADDRFFSNTPHGAQKTTAKLIGKIGKTRCVITVEAPGEFDEACGKAVEEILSKFG